MYLSFYGLAEKPFSQTPDPKFLYWNDAYRETIASLRYGIQERKGFVTMIGEAGTGKTTLLRKLLDDLGPEVVSVFLFNPNASFEEILEYTLSELGIPATTGRKLAMLQRLNDFLLAAFNEGKTTILLIDEAQDLETEVLESLRLLSNLETSKEKILQIVLSGQPELAARLAQPNLRQLKQRIAVRCRLEPLGRHELAEYIAARVAVAGGRSDLFAPDTLELIWEFARGIPRLINTVCDNALLVGYALGRQTIDRAVVAEVVSDLAKIDLPVELPPPPPVAAGPNLAPPTAAGTMPASPPASGEAPSGAAPAAEPAPPVAPAAVAPAASQASRWAAPAPAGPPPAAPRAPAPERTRPAPRRARHGMRWAAVVVLLFGIAVAGALAAGGWDALEPRVARLLGEPGGRGAGGAGDVVSAAPALQQRMEQAPAAAPTRDAEPAPLPTVVVPDPEPAAAAVPAAPERVAAARPAASAEAVVGDPAAPANERGAPDGAERELGPNAAAREVAEPSVPADAAREPSPAGSAARSPTTPVDASGAAFEAPPAERAPLAIAARVPTAPAAAPPQDLQPARRGAASAKRIRVQRGDTLMNLATREYGVATYTTLDVLRAANPGIEDVNRIIAGSEILFPDPGPGSRLVDGRDGVAVLVATTPVLAHAQEMQRLASSRYRLPADLEPILLGDGRNLYRVSLRRVPDRERAMQIAEALGSILQDPS